MYNFFVSASDKYEGYFLISASDRNHIINVLRMKYGEHFLVSCEGSNYLCSLENDDGEVVRAAILEENYLDTELPARILLYQGLPKGEKMELIIQKAVELGVDAVIPVEMSRSIVKLDEKKENKRIERWQAIAESAAKQSKRTVIPKVSRVMSYREALESAKQADVFMLPYENERGTTATREAVDKIALGSAVSILIGPEGGISPKELELAKASGAICVSLGKRVLRTETAAITAVGMCMLHIEMLADANNGQST